MREESGLLGVTGMWKGEPVNLVNVYAPFNREKKKELWELLMLRMRGRESERWCVSGDFNTVRNESERRGVSIQDRRGEMRDFNTFIENAGLVDLPLYRRRFIWYRGNGTSCSHLDRFLLSSGWLGKWPNVAQFGLKRKVTDHAAIILKEDVTYWGPRPF